MGRAQPKRQSNRRQTGASRGLPGWAMLTIGLIIGLFVAFLVYLDDLDSPPSSSVERQPAEEQAPDTEGTAAAEEGDDEESPRFEFYSILPELEVVVPDASEKESEAGGEGAPGAPDDSGEGDTGTPPESAGRYYLQAGSFQKAEQADRMKARISLLGLDVDIQEVNINGENWHRVRAGPYTDSSRLKDAQNRLRSDDIDYLVTRDKSSG